MFPTEPPNIQFFLPAQDPLGREEVHGKLRFLPGHLEINWRLKGSVFTGGKGEMRTIEVPYQEIEHVALVRRFFKVRRLDLRISDPALVKEIPGVTMGKMSLHIDKRSRKKARKLNALIDYNRSLFLLDEQTKRLEALK